ncbi:hypothetical protein cce_5080 [Crocosphaera subtropica ATCC 51142]|uniref:Uncharacterized protein n=1 Tax=Crocosphaera subtropica (strain ATCC 51142 / BH68) TaxID=43989 RepID=B1X2R5_CROS5|nr:hypothetical protein [Crocosphaera subtropica]ACB54426.1 hypothetical protein cce_5080 [Crocosphaera subtropica ATCC 51142]
MLKIKEFLNIKSSLSLFLYFLGIILCLGIALLNTQGLIDVQPIWGRLGLLPYLVMDINQNQNSNWIYNILPILMIDQIIYQQGAGVSLFLSLWVVFLLTKKSDDKKEPFLINNNNNDNDNIKDSGWKHKS